MIDVAVEADRLTKHFHGKTALSEFSVRIPREGTHAVVGSNGAGKSTLFRLLLGILTPSSGSCRLLGQDSQNLGPAIRGKVGYVNEEHTLPSWMTAAQVTEFQKHFYPGWDQSTYRQVIGNFDVGPQQRVKSLSRGERAGLNLAIALAQSPDLLILDEPTLGIDVVAKKAFLESLMFTCAERETTVIYCSHQMEEIERLAESLLIMEQGHLKNHSSPEEFCDRVSYWQVSLPEGVTPENLPGLLTSREIEGFWHINTLDQGPEFRQNLEQIGAQAIRQGPVNLESAVNAFLGKNHHTPQQERRRAS